MAVSFAGSGAKLKHKPSAHFFRPTPEKLETMSASELEVKREDAIRHRDYHLNKDEGDQFENRQERASEWNYNAQLYHAQQRTNAWANFKKIRPKMITLAKIRTMLVKQSEKNQKTEKPAATESVVESDLPKS